MVGRVHRKTEAIPVISLFTGGGFLDLGFERAGFRTVYTNEVNPEFAELFVEGTKHVKVHGRLWRPPEPEVQSIIDLKAAKVLKAAFGGVPADMFGVVGGPPCPDFSRGGRNGGGNGQNGRLTNSFVQMVCRLAPTFFVMENVPGLYRTKKHRAYLDRRLDDLREAGYLLDMCILNALHFGAPQLRERLFVVGVRKRIAYRALDVKSAKALEGQEHWFPWPIGPFADAESLPWPDVNPFGAKPKKPTGIPDQLTVYSVLKASNDMFNAYSQRFKTRPEGCVRYKSFKRLHRYRFAPTMWFGNREVHLHPWKPRRLSVREAMRLQTIPDEYILPADATLSAKFALVGNGVPCVLAEAIARSLLMFVSGLRGQ
jgi:DNA (cytosine-5)-methyltransferase 1